MPKTVGAVPKPAVAPKTDVVPKASKTIKVPRARARTPHVEASSGQAANRLASRLTRAWQKGSGSGSAPKKLAAAPKTVTKKVAKSTKQAVTITPYPITVD
jgi:hypothetical protein